MKRVLLINDVVGGSHVGMVAMLPILTHYGHAVFNLPTALVSNTLDYGDFNILDTTEYMRGTLPVWQRLGFRFDAVCTGLMFSEEQACTVADYCRGLQRQGCRVYVDPIMGDGGHLYNGMGKRQVELMQDMVSVADLTFPNLTEACYLTGIPFQLQGYSWVDARRLVDGIVALGARSVLVTSAKVEGHACVMGRTVEGETFKIDYDEIPVSFHGTGDIFSAVLIGHLLNDAPLPSATEEAMRVVSRLIERNRYQPDKCLGIPVEQCLDLL